MLPFPCGPLLCKWLMQRNETPRGLTRRVIDHDLIKFDSHTNWKFKKHYGKFFLIPHLKKKSYYNISEKSSNEISPYKGFFNKNPQSFHCCCRGTIPERSFRASPKVQHDDWSVSAFKRRIMEIFVDGCLFQNCNILAHYNSHI